jgi:hypothetical protein
MVPYARTTLAPSGKELGIIIPRKELGIIISHCVNPYPLQMDSVYFLHIVI